MANVSLSDFSVLATGGDWAPAIEAALAALGSDHKGGVLTIPPGTYSVSRAIYIRKCCIIRGSGTGQSGYNSTELVFPGTDGLIVDLQTPAGRAEWTVIENLSLRSLVKSGNGVVLYRRATLRNVFVEGFGVGIMRNSDGAGRNMNQCLFENVSAVNNLAAGFYTRGSDSNSGTYINCDATINGEHGFYDESLTGNTYIGCHTSANGGPGFHVLNSGAGGMLVNCYTEGGSQPPSYIGPTVTSIGGTHGAGWSANTAGLVLGGRHGQSSHSVTVKHPDGKSTTVFVGSAQEPDAGIRLSHTDDYAGLVLGRYAGGSWQIGAVNAAPAMRIQKGSNRPTFDQGIQIGGLAIQTPAPRIHASNGNPVGSGLNWMARRGDLILNQQASATQKGWVCVQNCGFGGRWYPSNGPYNAEVLVTPSVPNGYAYRLAADSPGWWTGSVEPVWPTTIGARVTDGTTIWECYGPTNEGLVPL